MFIIHGALGLFQWWIYLLTCLFGALLLGGIKIQNDIAQYVKKTDVKWGERHKRDL